MTDAILAAAPSARPSLAELARIFAGVGVFSFGGATAQLGMLHKIAVEERGWLDEPRYLRALNLCMLLPGPEAQQVATYIGWHVRGTLGGIVAGVLFVLPGALLMLGLSALYVLGSGVGWIDGLFFGIKAAVLAVVLHAVIKIGKRALRTRALITLAIASFCAFAFVNLPFPLVIASAAIAGAWLGAPAGQMPLAEPMSAAQRADRWQATFRAVGGGLVAWWLPVALAALVLGTGHVVVDLALFFSKLAVLTFGGAYALLAWLADAAVGRGWVTTEEMVTGLGLAETTPGPTILVTQFVGFIGGWKSPGDLPPLVSAVLAGLFTTWVTFAPSFLWIFAAGPWLDDLLRNRILAGAMSGITAAVVGAVAWLALWFALNTIFGIATFGNLGLIRWPQVDLTTIDVTAALLAVAAIVAMFVLKRGMIETIAAAAVAGVVLRGVLQL